MPDFGPEFYRERSEQGKIARMDRLISTKLDLINEKKAHDYLVENGKTGAANMIAANITRLESRITKLEDDDRLVS